MFIYVCVCLLSHPYDSRNFRTSDDPGMKVSLNRTDVGKQNLFGGILDSSIVFPWDLAFSEVNIYYY